MTVDEENNMVSKIIEQTNKFLSDMIYIIKGKRLVFRTVVWSNDDGKE